MRAQCLAPRLSRSQLVDAVKAACGINAQLPSAMALSLRARVRGLSLQELESTRLRDRTLVRTWCMRGTMHLLAADDVDWLLGTIAPSVLSASWRWLERRGGLERERAAQIVYASYRILKRYGPMARRQLMEAVAQRHGADIKAAAAGIVQLNGLMGRLCFGPYRGAEPTYAALDAWLGRKVTLAARRDNLRLARRYLKGYGPAAPSDLAAWWGMSLTDAKAAWSHLREELIQINVEGEPLWQLPPESANTLRAFRRAETVSLLPAFDNFLLGYRSRDFAVPPLYQDRVFHGGEIAPTVMVNGCAAGIWRYQARGKVIGIRVMPFAPFTRRVTELIAEEAEDVARFFGLVLSLGFSDANGA